MDDRPTSLEDSLSDAIGWAKRIFGNVSYELSPTVRDLRWLRDHVANLRDAVLSKCRDDLVESVKIRRVEIVDGGIRMEMTDAQELLLQYAAAALVMLDGQDAPNYVEMQMAVPQLPHETVTLTLQRHRGKTPHQLQMQAEAERDTLAALLRRCQSEQAP